MRRYFVLLLSIIFILDLHSEDDLSIGITWYGQSVMSQRVAEGTIEVLRELVPDLQIEKIPNISSEDEFLSVINRFNREKDAIAVLRSNGTQFLVDNPQPLPSFIGATNNPVLLGAISNLERPGGNITGVSYIIDPGTVFNFFLQIKKILIL